MRAWECLLTSFLSYVWHLVIMHGKLSTTNLLPCVASLV